MPSGPKRCSSASRVGAYLALASGGCATLGLKPVQRWLNLTKEELGFEITVEYVGLGTVSLAVVLMVVGSLLFPDEHGPDEHGPDERGPVSNRPVDHSSGNAVQPE